LFLDFGIMAVLLVIAHILRSRLRLLQNLFVPTAIIAGFLGLAGGPQGLDVLPFSEKPTVAASSDEVAAKTTTEATMTEYPFYLVVLLFATLLRGAFEA
jgi:ESS family glutamate:Na+ symporter